MRRSLWGMMTPSATDLSRSGLGLRAFDDSLLGMDSQGARVSFGIRNLVELGELLADPLDHFVVFRLLLHENDRGLGDVRI